MLCKNKLSADWPISWVVYRGGSMYKLKIDVIVFEKGKWFNITFPKILNAQVWWKLSMLPSQEKQQHIYICTAIKRGISGWFEFIILDG